VQILTNYKTNIFKKWGKYTYPQSAPWLRQCRESVSTWQPPKWPILCRVGR